MGKHGPSIKNDDVYEAVRAEGASKEKAARIANATASPSQHPSTKGGAGKPYEARTKAELYRQARRTGIDGRFGMSKDELIDALRNH